MSGLVEDSGKKDDKGKPIMAMAKGAIESRRQIHLAAASQQARAVGAGRSLQLSDRDPAPSFKAPLSDNMIGTGPFALADLKVGDKCVLKRVTKTKDGKDFNYWGGKVYLDEIAYYNFDGDNQLGAFASGDVHTLYDFTIEQMDLAKSLPGVIHAVRTAQNICCRMQVDQKPFSDKRVRQAITPRGRQRQSEGPRLRRGRRRRREPSRRAGASRLRPAAAAEARRRRRQEAACRCGIREGPGSVDRRRQHRRALAPDRVRGDARPDEGSRHLL